MATEMFSPELELFNDSLARCLRGGQFFQRFYELFLASSPEVREKFRGTDFRRQRRMLQTSFYMLVEYVALGWPECEAYLERIAGAHGRRGRNIPPHLYDLWLDCLLHVVQECDPLCSPEIETAWRYVMSAGIDFVKARYDRAGAG
ncbi:MAG TPA: globin [Steroidobacteraceae bacterium]|nr:globin [Steroidobacteraceae bacterium]